MLESGLSHEVLGECASVRSQNSSHFPSPENVKTWTLSLVLLSLCRDRNYKRNPKTLTVQKLSFLSDFSLLIPLVLWLNNGRVTILCRRMMKQSRRGGGILCKIGLINFLFMQLSQPLLRNLQSLCCCPQWTSWISFLWIFCPRFMIFDMIFVGTVQMMTTMLQLETNITVALSVAWLETRVRNLK